MIDAMIVSRFDPILMICAQPREACIGLIGSLPRFALARCALWLVLVLMVLSGCSQNSKCEIGLCPIGTECDSGSGKCVEITAKAPNAPKLRGAYAVVALPGLSRAFLGYASAEQSLVWIEQQGAKIKTQFIAGPAAGDGPGPQGQVCAAVAAANGDVHIVWISDKEQTLWYGLRTQGRWKRTRIDAVPPKRAARHVAITLFQGAPLIAFEDEINGGVSVVTRDDKGVFSVETVPLPTGANVVLQGDLSLVGGLSGVTLGMYDAIEGDLLLASRSSTGWKTARFAGNEPNMGSDAGLPVVLGRDLAGGLLVAWRDRTRNEVMLARSVGGKVQKSVITDGLYAVENRQISRRKIVGTALAIAVLPNGRSVVAVQDASQARIVVATEQANGQFKAAIMPTSDRAQFRPKLIGQVDGTVLVSWLEIDPNGSGEGRLTTWILTQPGESP
ncbi:MAG: hypothetical protein CMH53_00700 [Myxococcales bacterium]|nr:hypothetical protein [Myxococcales bacterium]